MVIVKATHLHGSIYNERRNIIGCIYKHRYLNMFLLSVFYININSSNFVSENQTKLLQISLPNAPDDQNKLKTNYNILTVKYNELLEEENFLENNFTEKYILDLICCKENIYHVNNIIEILDFYTKFNYENYEFIYDICNTDLNYVPNYLHEIKKNFKSYINSFNISNQDFLLLKDYIFYYKQIILLPKSTVEITFLEQTKNILIEIDRDIPLLQGLWLDIYGKMKEMLLKIEGLDHIDMTLSFFLETNQHAFLDCIYSSEIIDIVVFEIKNLNNDISEYFNTYQNHLLRYKSVISYFKQFSDGTYITPLYDSDFNIQCNKI